MKKRFLCLLLLVSISAGCSPYGVHIIEPPENFEYASCPDGMALVEAAEFGFGPSVLPDDDDDAIPKPIQVVLDAFCIDRLPAQEALDTPKLRVTYVEALKQCRDRGPRFDVCTEYQWERAARGNRLNTYPYGNEYRPGMCPEAVGSPIGETSGCVSDLGVIGMTQGAGEWARGGNWVWEDVESASRPRTTVRGLGTNEKRHAMSRLETYAYPNELELEKNATPVLDDILEDNNRFEDKAIPLDPEGKMIVSMSSPDLDPSKQFAHEPFSPLRSSEDYLEIIQGYRCCKSVEIQRKTSTAATE